ncbi:MAG: hypothetical protein GF329_09985 [Candidatus Lokiarchaeota archaeon]|nr:hypothetical protein [Candidatus Lokiarchaeota archaeon]
MSDYIIFNAIIKIGGSLANKKEGFTNLCHYLKKLYDDYKFIIVPGGGVFADQVRSIDKEFNLDKSQSHFMAIFSESLFGYLIYTKLSNSKLVSKIDSLYDSEKYFDSIPILLPFKYFIDKDPLPHTWKVTSDSIAYYLGQILGIEKVILVKDVDGLYTKNPMEYPDIKLIKKISATELSKIEEDTCVDKHLSKLIKKYKKSCYLVNGFHPKRIRNILKDISTVSTLIYE